MKVFSDQMTQDVKPKKELNILFGISITNTLLILGLIIYEFLK